MAGFYFFERQLHLNKLKKLSKNTKIISVDKKISLIFVFKNTFTRQKLDTSLKKNKTHEQRRKIKGTKAYNGQN